MRTRSLGVVVAIVLGLIASSRGSQATTLTLAPGPPGYLANVFLMGNAGVYASVGGNPIAPVPYEWPSVGGATGSMTLTPVGTGDEADVRFSVSLFSDADPYLMTGSYAPTGVPVTLRIYEMSFEVPGLADPPARVGGLHPAPPLSSTETIRGSLTVGTTTVPFSNTSTCSCLATDGATGPGLPISVVSPDRVTVGYPEGPGLFSSIGFFPAMDLITIDGVTFGTTAIYPDFFLLNYVPEPSSTALLAVASASLLLLMRRRPSRA